MTNLMTTRLSSKGQVVLPEALRAANGWDVGTAFTVVTYRGAVIMKPIIPPTEAELAAEFDAVFSAARSEAKSAGLTRKDVVKDISDVRALRRARRVRG